MPEFTLTAPQDIKIGDTTYHIVAPAIATPIGTPPIGRAQTNVARIGSGDWIKRADGNRLDIISSGVILYRGQPIPGSTGSVAVGYDPATNSTYRQARADGPWIYWGGSMTDAANWRTPTTPWTPPGATVPPVVVVPPVLVPPVTGGATPRDRMMAYLRGISGKQCLIGQTTHSPDDPRDEFKAVTQAFGFSPAIMFVDPWLDQWAGNAPYNPAFMPAALEHAKTAIVGMSLILPNPITNANAQGGPRVDPGQLLTPGSTLNNALNRNLDLAAGLLQQFKDAGRAVLTRFLLELDGGWFWWGSTTNGGAFTPAEQTQLFRYIVNYLRGTRGLDNLLTTFAINGGPGDYEYPGDDVVDITGIDCYTNDLASRYRAQYDKLRAKAPTKLFALTEDGSGDPNGPDRSYDQWRLKRDIQDVLPMTCFANFWSGWGPNLATNGREAMSDPFWINKGQVNLP